MASSRDRPPRVADIPTGAASGVSAAPSTSGSRRRRSIAVTTGPRAGTRAGTRIGGGSAPSKPSQLETVFKKWVVSPDSVHTAWDAFFRRVTEQARLAYAKADAPEGIQEMLSGFDMRFRVTDLSEEEQNVIIDRHLLLQHIIRSYQVRGHLMAELDPLGLPGSGLPRGGGGSVGGRGRRGMAPERIVPLLAARNMDDLDQEFRLPEVTFVGGTEEQTLPLREIIKRLDEAYCRRIGVEYMYMTSHEKLQWIRRQFEPPGCRDLPAAQRRAALLRLMRATAFEAFLGRKWSTERRFGLEGCEALVPALLQLIDRAAADGVELVVIGSPHRGRLNLLANVCEKPLRQILVHFCAAEPTATGSGDLKYHLGTLVQRQCADGRKVALCLMATPSHLESADPVVQGRTRAEQFLRGDATGNKVMSILIHGDAAFCGEGVVYETFHLSHLPNYTTHGSVHIVINNQVGFTTDPRFSRSSPYCTDVARVVNAPILHVNADYPDEVVHCCNVAAAYRARFHDDVVIDLVGYRRNGHNEADEPMFTQPLMYKAIRRHMPVLDIYTQTLVDEKIITLKDLALERLEYDNMCEREYTKSLKETTFSWSDWLDSPWKGFFSAEASNVCKPTGVSESTLRAVAERAWAPPPRPFELHPGVEGLLWERTELARERVADWAMAEALALGSLLREGKHVRLSGQDVERGVFSQRHHVLHHQSQDKVTYVPLQHMFKRQGRYDVCNSSLSECGVLGFEVGYAMASPHWLVLWEAQFGDFCNNAQCIIDQFLASGESKWTRQCGLVLLCPHGLEGMGPEHSCAPVLRFLQLTSDDGDAMPSASDARALLEQLRDANWIVANCTTPANLFHVLRRQLALPFRKPLVLFTPKGALMRSPEMRSPYKDFLEGTEFLRVIPDTGLAFLSPEEVKRHILCSGKVYYEFMLARRERELEEVIALTRIEQLCPFPYDAVLREMRRYRNAELCWAQEEHKNHGPWNFMLQRLGTILSAQKGEKRQSVRYIGRPASPSAAAGSRLVHYREQAKLIEEAMTLEPLGEQRSFRVEIVRSVIPD